jgi:hypothetical protein
MTGSALSDKACYEQAFSYIRFHSQKSLNKAVCIGLSR